MPAYKHNPAFDSGLLPVSALHSIHYAQYGKPDGKPVVFLHGGPGGVTSIENTAFFDPAVYRVILLDQRGCGKSMPHGEVRENTTQHLAADVEALRAHLGIGKWHVVFGGSWGSTLALFYAQAYPQSVGALVLRGVCVLRKWELEWLYLSAGPAVLFPREYRRLIEYLPVEERTDPLKAYHKLLASDDPLVYLPASREWNRWETTISKIETDPGDFQKIERDDAWSLSHGRMETHYFVNDAFLEEGQLLKEDNIARIRNIPCSIVQGRLDLICPPATAVELHEALPSSKLYIIEAAGHSAMQPGIFEKLIDVMDEYGRESFLQ